MLFHIQSGGRNIPQSFSHNVFEFVLISYLENEAAGKSSYETNQLSFKARLNRSWINLKSLQLQSAILKHIVFFTFKRLKQLALKSSFSLTSTTVLMAFAMFGIALSTNLCFCFYNKETEHSNKFDY